MLALAPMIKRKPSKGMLSSLILVGLILFLIFSSSFSIKDNLGFQKTGPVIPNDHTGKYAATGVNLKNKQAPYLRVMDHKGNVVELADLKGKVVFINFWATWCPPCIQEMPSIRKLYKRFKEREDMVFLLIDIDGGGLGLSKTFLSLRGIDLPVYKMAGEIPKEFLPAGIPTSLLIDKANYVAARQIGGADYSRPEIIAKIEQLLAERI